MVRRGEVAQNVYATRARQRLRGKALLCSAVISLLQKPPARRRTLPELRAGRSSTPAAHHQAEAFPSFLWLPAEGSELRDVLLAERKICKCSSLLAPN